MSSPSGRPIRTADGDLTLDAFARRGTAQGNNAVQINREEFMALPWGRGGGDTLEFTHKTEGAGRRGHNVESLWIYRIPHVEAYSFQIYRIINDCWDRLPELWKQGCWVQLRFSFRPDNPRFTDSGEGPVLTYSYQADDSEGPEYYLRQVHLAAKSYNNH